MENKSHPLLKKSGFSTLFNKQDAIRVFFTGNALMSIVILISICVFLGREGVLFFPKYHEELTVYRQTGQEYVDYIKLEVDEGSSALSALRRARSQESIARFPKELAYISSWNKFCLAAEKATDDQIDEWEDLVDELDDLEEDQVTEKNELTVKLNQVKAEWRQVAEASFNQKLADPEFSEVTEKLDAEEIERLRAILISYDPVEADDPAEIISIRKKIKESESVYNDLIKDFTSTVSPLKRMRDQLSRDILKIKNEAVAQNTAKERKVFLTQAIEDAETEEIKASIRSKLEEVVVIEDFPYAQKLEFLYEAREQHLAELRTLSAALPIFEEKLPDEFKSEEAEDLVNAVKKGLPVYKKLCDDHLEFLPTWSHTLELPFMKVISSFFLGTDWVTNSTWQDFYGFLPLFWGSILISFVALGVSVPVSIAAAIYVNQLSSRLEQNTIKPAIEFIQAIPSVVLGFLGITMIGPLIQEVSQLSFLAWIPGFPLAERLNILNAGLILALMAIPTIFTLCEDALNNVPSNYTQAALSLGSTRVQTVLKVVLPAAVSGVLAAVLLGFGRVIGETMVVLLVAGNRIAIPDFTQGLTVFTQPAHTMTGIIAQEMGEVSGGSLHWRALFLIGLVLFSISLFITVASQQLINRKKK